MADSRIMAGFVVYGNLIDFRVGVFLISLIIFYAISLAPIQLNSAKPLILHHSPLGTGLAIVKGH